MDRRELPIFEIERRLVDAVARSRRFVLQAPTGSGKSTQVPQMLLDHGLLGPDGEVIVLQPRRLPTRVLARRVAIERGVRLGGEVGYQMRFENVTSRETRIRYVTEGTLLRRMISEPDLPGVSALLFDEFHERHLYGDVTLARALELARTRRPDLLLGVMSATLEAAPIAAYLDPCTVLESSGRTYPVEVRHADRPYDFDRFPVWDAAAEALQEAWRSTDGDVLVFMPGSYEIQRTLAAIRATPIRAALFALHGELPPDQQDAALDPCADRKVIVSTNVAETSLTIPGVRLVIDSGLARIPRFDPNRGINTLLVERISRASAEQRAGRAGRTAPGVCIRLWTAQEHASRPAQELPEIRRLDLAEVILTLKEAGVEDLATFCWFEPPDPKSLARAIGLLEDLGGLDARTGGITAIGRRMLRFPVHPRYARMLLGAAEFGCVRPAAAVAAITQSRGLLLRTHDKRIEEERADLFGDRAFSDFAVLMRAWRFAATRNHDPGPCRRLGVHAQAAREVTRLFEQFLAIAEREGLEVSDREAPDDALARSILLGFSDQVGRRLDRGTLRCDLVHKRRGVLVRESAVRDAELLVVAEVREIQGRDNEPATLLSLATEVKEEWLRELFPADFTRTRRVEFDPVQKRVVAREATVFRDLVLDPGRLGEPTADEAAPVLAAEVIEGRCTLEHWDAAVEQWIERINSVAAWFPEWEIPPVGPDDRALLIEQVCHGAVSYREIKDRPVIGAVRGWLAADRRELVEKMAPERLPLPGGRAAKVQYRAGAAPQIAARIQDLYGLDEGLFVGGGRIPVVIQVLAPNHRPVQVTQNLRTFWAESYPKLKLELQRKYPKHKWQ